MHATSQQIGQTGSMRQISKRDRILVLVISVVAFVVIFRPVIGWLNFWRGDQFAMTGEFSQATGPYRKSILLDPGEIKPRLALAGTYYFLRRYKASAQEYQAALSIEPSNDEAHFYLGLFDFRAHDYARAQSHFAAASRRGPFSLPATRFLALSYEKAGRRGAAIETLRRMARKFPRTAPDAKTTIERLNKAAGRPGGGETRGGTVAR